MLEALNQLDGQLLLWIQENLRHSLLTDIFRFITSLGDGGSIWIMACIVCLIPKKTRTVGVMGLLALLGSLIVNNHIIKNLVARPRPFYELSELLPLIPKPGEYSFPSGHTASSFAAAAVFYRKLPKKYGIPAMLLAFLIAFSRMYLGVHYPGDVIAGIVSGIVLSYLGEWIVNMCRRKYAVT